MAVLRGIKKMATITLYELSSYNNAYLLPFTIELDGLSYEEYLEAIQENMERLKDRVLAGLEGDDIKRDLEEGFLNFEEWIVADTEDIPEQFVWTYDIDSRFFDFLESDIDPEVYEAYINCMGIPDDVESIEDSYSGEYDSLEDFAYEQSCGYLSKDNPLVNYVDWEHVGNELMHEYAESNNHYFRYI
jgi:antirestriction protein